MSKFRIVLEIEIDESTEINQQVIEANQRDYQDFMADPEQVESLRYEQTLLATLLRSPGVYKEFITANIVSRLEGMSWRDMFPLAGIEHQDFEVLADVVPLLPPAAKAYYEESLRDGWFYNATDLIVECFNQY